MRISKITDVPTIPSVSKRNYISNEQLQREFDYWRAENILRKMHSKGLISEVEFTKIIALNRRSFSPMYAQIMSDKP
ncbi:hypothetical protein EDD66_10528 [Mobilisporobacter senegalensis]|uniref:SHOCT-like domain-containing protein n=1 Tax=Mobilisporobacter senegalensis TaxID=1329262 RepID=A0A3N1XMZ8_9FIRM|nr:SHOCT domain-containing protein [Mobilisporobacter senegalensis]ROR28090.1 hypothetical protein EDD66_10528 [Mobilisporobacter senegalensis]